MSVDKPVKTQNLERNKLLPLLQAIQKKFGYLPSEELKKLSAETRISLADITSVASFYAAFRFKPAGRYAIKVCVGAACHVKGAEAVYEAFRRLLNLSGDADTDADGIFTLSKVACLGCCMMAPAVLIDNRVYGWVEAKDVALVVENFLKTQGQSADSGLKVKKESDEEIRICLCSSCSAGGSSDIYKLLKREILRNNYVVKLREVACTGMSYRTPLLQIANSEGLVFDYGGVKDFQVSGILAAHFSPNGALKKMRGKFGKLVDALYSKAPKSSCACPEDSGDAADYTRGQKRIVTEFAGEISPLDFEAYKENGGFEAYGKSLEIGSEKTMEELALSGLRGRGGGGFPTAKKWNLFAPREGEKYLICNADEGDPGAFMDRMLLESFPFRVLEGMMIASAATKATKGIIYIREEYAQAIEVLHSALEILRKEKFLPAANSFDIEIFEGAGAFVCGEETALIASLEGFRGEPRLRPPFPAESGYLGRPTLINNVETYANLAWIISKGGAEFAKIGTEKGKGAKTFALAGKIRRGGLIEVPMGMSLHEILEQIGGGPEEGRTLKAVQIGGPSGGCIPASMFDVKVDYEELRNVGAIMGSGGMVALDDRDCMVDIAAYFLKFITEESCGKCTACRVGTAKMLDIINAIRAGDGKMEDLDELEKLGNFVRSASLCGLGKSAPNPTLSGLRYFRDEFVEHINGRCKAGKCVRLTSFVVNDKCIGCTKCFQACAANAIEFKPFEKHSIDSAKCVRCGACRDACPVDAIDIQV